MGFYNGWNKHFIAGLFKNNVLYHVCRCVYGTMWLTLQKKWNVCVTKAYTFSDKDNSTIQPSVSKNECLAKQWDTHTQRKINNSVTVCLVWSWRMLRPLKSKSPTHPVCLQIYQTCVLISSLEIFACSASLAFVYSTFYRILKRTAPTDKWTNKQMNKWTNKETY